MARKVSFSAVAVALSVICLYGAATLPTGRLVMLALASLFVAIRAEQFGVRYGVMVYLGTSLLALFLVQRRVFVVAYILFAGLYPLVKLAIERLNRLWAEWVLKLLYCNAVLLLIYALFQTAFLPAVGSVGQYAALSICGAELVFVIYDLALSYMIGYYHRFLRRMHHE